MDSSLGYVRWGSHIYWIWIILVWGGRNLVENRYCYLSMDLWPFLLMVSFYYYFDYWHSTPIQNYNLFLITYYTILYLFVVILNIHLHSIIDKVLSPTIWPVYSFSWTHCLSVPILCSDTTTFNFNFFLLSNN